MLLTIDVGNTTTGGAIFSDGVIISKNKLLTPQEINVLFLKSLAKSNAKKMFNKPCLVQALELT